MQLIRKSFIAVMAVITLLFGIIFCACADESEIIENDRIDITAIRDPSLIWRFNAQIVTCIYPRFGLEFSYEFGNATVEMGNASDKAEIVFLNDEQIKNSRDYSSYEKDGDYKKFSHSQSPLKYEGRPKFYWMPFDGWSADNQDEIVDYVTFIAKEGNYIVGYSVMYVHAKGENASGDVLADKVFPKINGKHQTVTKRIVDGKIREAIEEHENMVADRGEEAGAFYTLTEAYEKGYLNLEQIISIAYCQNGGKDGNEEIIGADYTPLPEMYKAPSDETDKAIKNCYYNSGYFVNDGYYTVYDFSCTYFCAYENVVAVKIGIPGKWAAVPVNEEKIENVIINYRNGLRILVWIKD